MTSTKYMHCIISNNIARLSVDKGRIFIYFSGFKSSVKGQYQCLYIGPHN